MRKISVSIVAVLLCFALCGFANAPVVSWGVTPNTKEQTPGAPAGGEKMLAEHDGLYVADTTDKKVYFTFDLGYEAGFTNQVLDILKEKNIKGIFFLCGHYVETKDELVNRMLDEGHQIGNHTDKHKDLPTLSDAGIKKDIVDFNDKFVDKYPDAPAMKFFRPGKGRFDARTLKIAKEQNLRTMLWSIAIVDWGKTPIDAKKSADKITSRVHPGAIILFHITNSGTPEMLKLLIPQLIEKGYTFGEPGEL